MSECEVMIMEGGKLIPCPNEAIDYKETTNILTGAPVVMIVCEVHRQENLLDRDDRY